MGISKLVDEVLSALNLGIALEAVFDAIQGEMFIPKFKVCAR